MGRARLLNENTSDFTRFTQNAISVQRKLRRRCKVQIPGLSTEETINALYKVFDEHEVPSTTEVYLRVDLGEETTPCLTMIGPLALSEQHPEEIIWVEHDGKKLCGVRNVGTSRYEIVEYQGAKSLYVLSSQIRAMLDDLEVPYTMRSSL